MTLCVAVAGQDHGVSRIVVASDWRVETETSSSEVQNKFYWIDKNWPALIAGDPSRALELIATFRGLFKRFEEKHVAINSTNIYDLLKVPLRRFKAKLSDEYVSQKYGITYKEFLSKGKAMFPEDRFDRLCHDIERIDLECDLIICRFLGGEPYIFRIHSTGRLELCEHFAAIGSGTDLAESSLQLREHEEDLPLSQAIFHVYEAMTLGAKAPGVGKVFTISVLSNPRGAKEVMMQDLTASAEKRLKSQFDKYSFKEFFRLGFPRNGLGKPY